MVRDTYGSISTFCLQIIVDYVIKVYGFSGSLFIGWQNNRDAVMLAWVVFLFFVLNGKNINTAWQDLGRGRDAEFKQLSLKRYAELQRGRGKDIYFDKLPVTPLALFVGDLGNDPSATTNLCTAQFFGAKSVTVK